MHASQYNTWLSGDWTMFESRRGCDAGFNGFKHKRRSGCGDSACRTPNGITESSLHVFVVVFCQNLGRGFGIVEEVVDFLDIILADGCPTVNLGE